MLPEVLRGKTRLFGEVSMGAKRATLVLADGSRIEHVVLAWGDEIVRVAGREIHDAAYLGFAVDDISDVVDES